MDLNEIALETGWAWWLLGGSDDSRWAKAITSPGRCDALTIHLQLLTVALQKAAISFRFVPVKESSLNLKKSNCLLLLLAKWRTVPDLFHRQIQPEANPPRYPMLVDTNSPRLRSTPLNKSLAIDQ